MVQLYEVAGPAFCGGAPVKSSKSLSSELLGYLGVGSIVSECERIGERVRLKKLSGSGPVEGWVSAKLLAKVDEAIAQQRQQRAVVRSSCVLAVAEERLERLGAAALLAAPGQGAEALVCRAAALLAQRSTAQALQAAQEALASFRAAADGSGEASASLLVAVTLLSGGEAAKALQPAMVALKLFRDLRDRQMEASALATLASVRLALHDSGAALAAAQEAVEIFEDIGDLGGLAAAELTVTEAHLGKAGPRSPLPAAAPTAPREASVEASRQQLEERRTGALALLQGGDVAGGLEALKGALALARQSDDKRCEADTLLVGAKVGLHQSSADVCNLALRWAQEAVALYRTLGCQSGEAVACQLIASIQLKVAGDLSGGLRAAESARLLFLKAGDARCQGVAAHAVAHYHLRLGDGETALQSAMEAATLATQAGDCCGEAAALHTAARTLMQIGRLPEALRCAREAQSKFKLIGATSVQQALSTMIKQLEMAIPGQFYGPRTCIAPHDNARLMGSESLPFEETPSCVIWSVPVNSQLYIMYCLELLKLVDDLKTQSSNTAILVTTQGVMARPLGQELASNWTAIGASTVWALVRTVRLESPRLSISTVDLPPGASPHEVTDCLRSAQISAGPRNEVAFFLDRRSRLKSNQVVVPPL